MVGLPRSRRWMSRLARVLFLLCLAIGTSLGGIAAAAALAVTWPFSELPVLITAYERLDNFFLFLLILVPYLALCTSAFFRDRELLESLTDPIAMLWPAAALICLMTGIYGLIALDILVPLVLYLTWDAVELLRRALAAKRRRSRDKRADAEL